MKKPIWIIEKEQAKRDAKNETFWLFGLHAVKDALLNPSRVKVRLLVTPNAAQKLKAEIEASKITPEICDPRKFKAPLDPQSVHQGAALEVKPLQWGNLETVVIDNAKDSKTPPRVLLLDRVTDPHNVGAILRSAEVFGACAVIGVQRHSAPETGALAKSASGALERQPYLRVKNLSETMRQLKRLGYIIIGLDGEASLSINEAVKIHKDRPIAFALGAEGPGLREKTRETCDEIVKIGFADAFGSLNVSNAAAVSLFALTSGA